MLSASLCRNCAVVNCENKSQMNLALRCGKAFDPDALCAGRSEYCYTGCVKIWVFRKGISPHVQKKKKKSLCWCNGAVHTRSTLAVCW